MLVYIFLGDFCVRFFSGGYENKICFCYPYHIENDDELIKYSSGVHYNYCVNMYVR